MNAIKPPKAVIIERSLSCFVWGLLGLIPVLGMPMALHAMQQHWRVKRDGKALWNPANRYLLWGIICSRLGFVLSIPIVVWITWVLYNAWLTS